MNETSDMIKSIRMGTVDFFGILIPGLLAVAVYAIGFFIPILVLAANVMGVNLIDKIDDPTLLVFILFVLLVFSYVLGYILRLSSPDQLDQISARNVIIQELERLSEQEEKENEENQQKQGGKTKREFKVGCLDKIIAQNPRLRNLVKCIAPKQIIREKENFKKFVEIDGWPYDPDEPMDKYPYFNFRNYLDKRGHAHLKDLVIWSPENETSKAKRSKSVVNRMKMNVRINCPELSRLLESKEGHIRLMAGTWTAFKLSIWPVTFIWIVITALAIQYQSLRWYFVYSFLIANLLALMLYSNHRIEKLFHYRRVSELFHIVEAAYIAQQKERETRSNQFSQDADQSE